MRNRARISVLWQRLLHTLRFTGPTWRSFQLDQQLLQALHGLAERERRPAEEVAAELLSLVLSQRDATDSLFQRWQSLSPREQQIAALTCLNFTNRQIASRLTISPETVKTHMRNLLYKFGVHSKAELRLLLAEWDFSRWD